jgi:hypothetical protein
VSVPIADWRLRIGRARLLALICTVAVVLSARTVLGDEIIERVLAVVAGDVITLADVTAAHDFGLVPSVATADPIADVLARLIDRSLMLAEVDRYAPPEPTPADIDGALAAVRGRFSTQPAFDAALARAGMDEKYLRETLRQDLRIRAYIEQRFMVPAPGDDELAAYYQAHIAAYTQNGRPIPLEEVRSPLAQAVIAERRGALVNTWVAGLRRRAEITNLYLTSK